MSFFEYLKKDDADEKTPLGALRKRFMELNPDVVFNWIDGVKCIDSLDSDDSIAWSKFLMKESAALQFVPCYGLVQMIKGLDNGDHIRLAEWFYNNACQGNVKISPVAPLTNFQRDFRQRVLTKLSGKTLDFQMSLVEKEALCSYLLLRNNFMKYKNLFLPDKLLALKVINRFAKAHDIRYEDAESVLREYTYSI